MKTIPQGAATTIYCALANDNHSLLKGGRYYTDVWSNGKAINYAFVEENMKKLFDLSEKMTGISLEALLKLEVADQIEEFKKLSELAEIKIETPPENKDVKTDETIKTEEIKEIKSDDTIKSDENKIINTENK